jgi:hypothetical protein
MWNDLRRARAQLRALCRQCRRRRSADFNRLSFLACGRKLTQDRILAAAILALFGHHCVVLEGKLGGELGVHQLLLHERVHVSEHAFGVGR